MRKVVGIGEAILDIIFENEQPKRSVVGGSVLNAMVSLSRLGVPVTFISEVGDDRVGDMICHLLAENGVDTHYIDRFEGRKSPVSLAFLGTDKSAEYIFHTDYPEERLCMPFPDIQEDDIFMFGSFYALNPVYRKRFVAFLEEAKRRKALLYYDPNFRSSHDSSHPALRRAVSENCEYATIVRGSREDFFNLYHKTEMDEVYAKIMKPHCRYFLTTQGADGVNFYTESIRAHFDSQKITPVSTIGAGDNFNAGIAYGLIKYGIRVCDLPCLSKAEWEKVIWCGMDLSSEVCRSYSNYISPEYAVNYKNK
ncbi:MAG: carbohydrate kinase [Tannerella sp.]|jgi:fructokinase|nr:carbohydrate kinase [Tannerella sp.]